MSKINFDECLYFASARVNRIVAKISDDQFKKLGLSSTAAFILMYLDTGDAINPSAIADELSLDRSTVTRFLDKLQRQGYIERTSQGRSVTVALTKAGLNLQTDLKQMWSTLNDQYIELLGADGEQTLRTLLNTDFGVLKANNG
ncbi:MarR family winged helix-turn-helix transcriptional regulator [Furfurilactobacillus milii]|uniref:MarR family transcriptional regulator n=1 Tax=Furfurilactobacillus rossiae TaxID=231049 RepID=A0A7C9MN28_9LACO|nr:MarR family transcriptional regulator [Furfurilactobacillus milii]MYV05685.1 MarR family transcriptional regulator [Furfurilactobacillus milii]